MEDLSKEQVEQFRLAFDTFDRESKGCISTDVIGTILTMLGKDVPEETIEEVILEFDEEGTGELHFEEFCMIAARFIVVEDTEAIQQELREAFRLYDKEGNGYITTEVFRDILQELDENMTEYELDMMIDEIDADGSGTLDFEEFMAVMTGE